MKKKSILSRKIQEKFEKIRKNPDSAPACFVGFDGFTDEILKAVDKRESDGSFKPIETMKQFGQRIVDASGKSANIELVRETTKLGGNGPILTNALLEGGHRITFAGAIGKGDYIEPHFQEMANRCEQVIALAPSAHSDAIEFQDGKLILGKLENLKNVNYETLLAHIGKDAFTKLLDHTDLFISANWTMLPKMTDIWRHIAQEIVPGFSTNKTRYMFVDLADPAKRTDEDVHDCVEALSKLNKTYRVILGLNQSEAERVARVIGLNLRGGGKEEMLKMAEAIQTKAKLYQVIVHFSRCVVSSTDDSKVTVDAPTISNIKIKTGAGDNFNAGFCNGLLYGLNSEEMILSGVATSSYYVGHGKSPTILEVAQFLKDWEKNEL